MAKKKPASKKPKKLSPFQMGVCANPPPTKTFAQLSREAAKQQKAFEKQRPKPTAKAKAVIDNPDLDGEGLTQKERFAVVLGLAKRIHDDDEGGLFERYQAHFEAWRAGADEGDVKVAMGLIFPEVDEGHLDHLSRFFAIIPFLFENDPDVTNEAAKMICIHHPVVDGDRLFGPKVVLNTVTGRYQDGREPDDQDEADAMGCGVAHAVSAVMSCGDKRLLPLLEDAWKKLPNSARLHLSQCQEEIPTEVEAEFWLNRAAEAKPGSADFKLAIEHLMLMADGGSRQFAPFADSLTRNEFNFGLERGDDEIRKTTSVGHDKFLTAHADTLARIEASPANKPFVARLLAAWRCQEA